MEVGRAELDAGLVFDIVDLDSGQPLKRLLYANEETGEWIGMATDADGFIYPDPDDPTRIATVRGRCRLKITPRAPAEPGGGKR